MQRKKGELLHFNALDANAPPPRGTARGGVRGRENPRVGLALNCGPILNHSQRICNSEGPESPKEKNKTRSTQNRTEITEPLFKKISYRISVGKSPGGGAMMKLFLKKINTS